MEAMEDSELIRRITYDPNSTEGKSAKEEFEYRKYLVLKRHNSWLLVLTIILTCSAIGQVIVAYMSSN